MFGKKDPQQRKIRKNVDASWRRSNDALEKRRLDKINKPKGWPEQRQKWI